MRAVPLALALFLSVLQATAQPATTGPSISQMLESMKSSKWAERSKGLEQASEALATGRLNPADSDMCGEALSGCGNGILYMA